MTKAIPDMTARELEALSASLLADLERINKERRRKADTKAQVDAALAEKRKPVVEPEVSDHAVLRFLERAKGVNVEEIRRRMLSPTIVSAINAGAVSITCDNLKFKVRNKVITTVLE